MVDNNQLIQLATMDLGCAITIIGMIRQHLSTAKTWNTEGQKQMVDMALDDIIVALDKQEEYVKLAQTKLNDFINEDGTSNKGLHSSVGVDGHVDGKDGDIIAVESIAINKTIDPTICDSNTVNGVSNAPIANSPPKINIQPLLPKPSQTQPVPLSEDDYETICTFSLATYEYKTVKLPKLRQSNTSFSKWHSSMIEERDKRFLNRGWSNSIKENNGGDGVGVVSDAEYYKNFYRDVEDVDVGGKEEGEVEGEVESEVSASEMKASSAVVGEVTGRNGASGVVVVLGDKDDTNGDAPVEKINDGSPTEDNQVESSSSDIVSTTDDDVYDPRHEHEVEPISDYVNTSISANEEVISDIFRQLPTIDTILSVGQDQNHEHPSTPITDSSDVSCVVDVDDDAEQLLETGNVEDDDHDENDVEELITAFDSLKLTGTSVEVGHENAALLPQLPPLPVKEVIVSELIHQNPLPMDESTASPSPVKNQHEEPKKSSQPKTAKTSLKPSKAPKIPAAYRRKNRVPKTPFPETLPEKAKRLAELELVFEMNNTRNQDKKDNNTGTGQSQMPKDSAVDVSHAGNRKAATRRR
ncbi:hypothetical protein HDU76_003723 [Blyttiomyces sp. JEL0837]|nr:hypothetical protein HDU76_003723 [Blyttiomyces sp. JEL0837]